MFDTYLQQKASGAVNPVVTVKQTVRKLDSDFFAGRWNRETDRQRQLLAMVAALPKCDVEFTVQEIVEQSQKLAKPFSAGHVNQILGKLMENGLPYKNRHGRYSFAVPLLGDFIRRQEAEAQNECAQSIGNATWPSTRSASRSRRWAGNGSRAGTVWQLD